MEHQGHPTRKALYSHAAYLWATSEWIACSKVFRTTKVAGVL